jgi:hypothetical protein
LIAEVDDVVAEFPFPRQKIYHGLFYGNHHEELKRLSADTSVRINVPDYSTANSHITLEGAADSVFRYLDIPINLHFCEYIPYLLTIDNVKFLVLHIDMNLY